MNSPSPTAATGDPLAPLLARGDTWRGRRGARGGQRQPSGFAALDRLLGGGWPLGALSELIAPVSGVGELRLLLPVLRQLTADGRALAWVDPPWVPYAHALAAQGLPMEQQLWLRCDNEADRVWALEQLLRSRQCGAVLAWQPPGDGRLLRRLQLAAESGGGLCVLWRRQAAPVPAPVALRLQLQAAASGLCIRLDKRRGGWGGGSVVLDPALPYRPVEAADAFPEGAGAAC